MREDARMQDRRDDYEPIIATRPSRRPPADEGQPLWRVVLALLGGLAVVVLIAWWWLGRSSSESASTAQQEGAATATAPEMDAETHVEQPIAPPARDAGAGAEVAQESTTPARAPQEPAAPTPTPQQAETSAPTVEPEAESEQAATTQEDVPEAPAEDEIQAPSAPAPVSVRFASPDSQVRFELRRASDSLPVLTTKAGDVVNVEPGTYRLEASGAGLETFAQEVTFDGAVPLEYTIELCAERKYERESLKGQIVEQRSCSSTEECESMFMILGEYADELVRDRTFRTQQCAKWRQNAAPDGSWTLNINCDGATPSTTCSIAISEGACTHAGPRRSTRGGTCPRVEFQ